MRRESVGSIFMFWFAVAAIHVITFAKSAIGILFIASINIAHVVRQIAETPPANFLD